MILCTWVKINNQEIEVEGDYDPDSGDFFSDPTMKYKDVEISEILKGLLGEVSITAFEMVCNLACIQLDAEGSKC